MALGEYPGVYAIFCKASGLPYIGASINVYARTFYHITALRRGRHESKKLLNAWRTYGENEFDIAILEFCSKEQLTEREQYYIDAWDAFNDGYNGNPGPQKTNHKHGTYPPRLPSFDIDDKQRLLTIKEFAEITNIAPKTLYRLASEGKIQCIRIGRNVRFRHDMLDQIKGASN